MVRKIAVRRAAQVSKAAALGLRGVWCRLRSPETHGAPGAFVLFVLQVFYNNKGYHSMPTYLNSLNNAILRANLPKSKGNPAAYGELVQAGPGGEEPGLGRMAQRPEAATPTPPCAGITVTNHPMNKTSASLSLDYL